MSTFSPDSRHSTGIFLLLVCLCAGIVFSSVSGADTSDMYEGNLGDVINLHGISYVGNQVYLFFTGPGLPENGVTLIDPTQRAEQGRFTVVGVDNDQQWSYKWNTARIDNEIVAGTYTVYVSNEPVDRAGISGNGYKTLTVYLKGRDPSDLHSSTGTSYTLNPEMHSSTPVATPSLVVTTITAPGTTVTIPPAQTPGEAQTPAKKTSLPVISGVIAVAGLGIILARSRADPGRVIAAKKISKVLSLAM